MSNASICQMQATFLGVEFLRTLFKFKKSKENSSCMSTSRSIKRRIRRFYVGVVQWASKKCIKQHDASMMHVQSCCFDH